MNEKVVIGIIFIVIVIVAIAGYFAWRYHEHSESPTTPQANIPSNIPSNIPTSRSSLSTSQPKIPLNIPTPSNIPSSAPGTHSTVRRTTPSTTNVISNSPNVRMDIPRATRENVTSSSTTPSRTLFKISDCCVDCDNVKGVNGDWKLDGVPGRDRFINSDGSYYMEKQGSMFFVCKTGAAKCDSYNNTVRIPENYSTPLLPQNGLSITGWGNMKPCMLTYV